NNFAIKIDEIPDNAVDFGSGFLKIWEVNGELKLDSIDPVHLYFDQYNFAKGKKGERFRTTARRIIANEKYDDNARELLEKRTPQDKLDDALTIWQIVEELPDDRQRVSIVDLENELVYLDYETGEGEKKMISYFKYD